MSDARERCSCLWCRCGCPAQARDGLCYFCDDWHRTAGDRRELYRYLTLHGVQGLGSV